jgi:hypothetical protein
MMKKACTRFGVLIAAVWGLGACAIIPEGESTCTGEGPNSPGWPYCAPSDPGGPGPVDDPIDPTGGRG